jgi:hypothetical protein
MREMLGKAFDHHGFSFVHIVAPCRTFGRATTLASLSPRIVDINRTGNHDPANIQGALQAAAHSLDFDGSETEPVPVGVFRITVIPTYEELMARRTVPVDKRQPFSSIIDDFSA